MNPMISIIVPVYNAERYLNRCVDSILVQTFADFEVLLIDDGSTDRSGQICDDYAGKDVRVKVFHKENGGVSSARNIGLENARGEWITFCDADDCLISDALERYLEKVLENVDMVMAGFCEVNEEGNNQCFCGQIVEKIIDRTQGLIEMYDPSDFPYQGYVWSKLLKASILRQNNIFFNTDISFNEDRLFLIEYLSRIENNILYKTCVVYSHYENSNGAMSSLKRGYNRKFVTDFDAFVLMKGIVKRLPEAEMLIPYANKGIIDSYCWNHHLMYKFHECSTRNHWHMVCGLIKAGVFAKYLKELLVPIAMLVYPQYFCRKR